MLTFSKHFANVATGVALASVAIAWTRQSAVVTAELMAVFWVLATLHTGWPLGFPGRHAAAEFSLAPVVRVSWLSPDVWACRRVFHPRSYADTRVTSEELRVLARTSQLQFLVPTSGRVWAGCVRLAHLLGALCLVWTLACAGGWITEDAVAATAWPLAPGWDGDAQRLSGVYFGAFWFGLLVVAWPAKVVLGPDGVELIECFWRRRFPGRVQGMECNESECQLRVDGETLLLPKPVTVTTAHWLGTWRAVALWRRDSEVRRAIDSGVGSFGIAR